MTQLPTYWYKTEAFWVGECTDISCFSLCLIHLFLNRLSCMANETGIKKLLLDAICLLVPANVDTCPGSRETSQRSLGARFSSPCHYVACWVSPIISPSLVFRLHRTAYRWSYTTNLTLIGHAVYMSMDIPDAFLAVRCTFFFC